MEYCTNKTLRTLIDDSSVIKVLAFTFLLFTLLSSSLCIESNRGRSRTKSSSVNIAVISKVFHIFLRVSPSPPDSHLKRCLFDYLFILFCDSAIVLFFSLLSSLSLSATHLSLSPTYLSLPFFSVLLYSLTIFSFVL